MDWVKGSRAVVADKHCSAALVATGEDLGAAPALALAIILADQLIAQVLGPVLHADELAAMSIRCRNPIVVRSSMRNSVFSDLLELDNLGDDIIDVAVMRGLLTMHPVDCLLGQSFLLGGMFVFIDLLKILVVLVGHELVSEG